ncbi:hypothetical protein N802_11235 [Knoellia sinensis KCTC 19936]|uniref:Uncharacterized protein n=1 Tax=Knoellia sinensis KCTC 19936 TaxID=1385520 RepID=A0A0A0J495_9MICO|nr:hypothetical protein [Knoellia sinensis]KGN32195.1 hypothetical protein N802_11235 [Knoellia sinensis KCTC 19936]
MGTAQTQTEAASAAPSATSDRSWRTLARRGRPFLAAILAALLWWPAGFGGYAGWMRLPLTAPSASGVVAQGSVVFLGCLAAAAVVSALVKAPWPRFGIAFGLTVTAWVLADGSADLLAGERPVLAGLAGLGMLLGLWVGARAHGGPVEVATFLAVVAGLSPATWSRGPLLAVAVALPFWVASKDRVAPTVWAVVRVVITWLLAVLVSVGLHHGWSQLRPGLAGSDPAEGAKVVGRGVVDLIREQGVEVAQASATTYANWLWLAVVLALALVVARTLLNRRRTKTT